MNSLLSLFTCIRKHTANTAVPTHDNTPERKALNGNEPTKDIYTTWMSAVVSANAVYKSMIFSLVGVCE